MCYFPKKVIFHYCIQTVLKVADVKLYTVAYLSVLKLEPLLDPRFYNSAWAEMMGKKLKEKNKKN
jgi:hypothetical protein